MLQAESTAEEEEDVEGMPGLEDEDGGLFLETNAAESNVTPTEATGGAALGGERAARGQWQAAYVCAASADRCLSAQGSGGSRNDVGSC